MLCCSAPLASDPNQAYMCVLQGLFCQCGVSGNMLSMLYMSRTHSKIHICVEDTGLLCHRLDCALCIHI